MDDNQTTDIHDVKEERSDPAAVRKSFRVPVEQMDGITAILNGETYSVSDINPDGISIFCKEKTAFTVGQLIKNCELILPGDSIKKLTAKVIHFSFEPEKEKKNGIHWIDLTEDGRKKIATQVSKIKQKLLANGKADSIS